MAHTTVRYLTTKDLCHIFGRSQMTIYLWRKNLDLPYIDIEGNDRNTIRFDWRSVEQWALDNDKKVVNPPA